MFPIGDDNPTLRTPVMTYAILAATVATWLIVQGAGLDPVTLAKVLSKWAKESPVFSFKAAVVEGRAIEVKDIEALANMPSKEELISKVMFLVNSGAQRLAVATAGVARNLAIVIDQVRAQKEEQGA